MRTPVRAVHHGAFFSQAGREGVILASAGGEEKGTENEKEREKEEWSHRAI